MCVHVLSRYVVLVPVRNKFAKSIAQALGKYLFCPFSTSRVLLIENGTAFSNIILDEICKQFIMKHNCTVGYHPASNGLVERGNRKILEILNLVVTCLLDT